MNAWQWNENIIFSDYFMCFLYLQRALELKMKLLMQASCKLQINVMFN